jgi:predicted secreted protein
MDNKMTQDLDFITGQISVLRDVCGAMVALHPHRKVIVQVAQNVLDDAAKNKASEYYKDGIKDILEVFAVMLNSALLAEQIQKEGLDRDKH